MIVIQLIYMIIAWGKMGRTFNWYHKYCNQHKRGPQVRMLFAAHRMYFLIYDRLRLGRSFLRFVKAFEKRPVVSCSWMEGKVACQCPNCQVQFWRVSEGWGVEANGGNVWLKTGWLGTVSWPPNALFWRGTWQVELSCSWGSQGVIIILGIIVWKLTPACGLLEHKNPRAQLRCWSWDKVSSERTVPRFIG